jgi:fatty acid desaturase
MKLFHRRFLAYFMKGRRPQALIAGVALLLVSLSCRPVIAIGWGELLIVAAVLLLVLFPLIFRVIRFLRKTREYEDRGEE